MKLLSFQKAEAKITIEHADDVYFLSQIVTAGDVVRGKTIRKIKIGDEGDRKQSIVKKAVSIAITVEKISFSKSVDALRVSGVITAGTGDVQKGEHHTFSLEPGVTFTLVKLGWLSFQRKRLQEAASEEVSKILICVMDRDEAQFALLKKYGYKMLSSIRGKVPKKGMDESNTGGFYGEVISKLEDYDKRFDLVTMVVASPAFWKEDLLKEITSDIKKKIILATCNSGGENGINEVLKRPEVKAALQQDRIAKEARLVDELLVEISKQAKAVYGIRETKQAIESGAVLDLLVTDRYIKELHENEKYANFETLLKIVEQGKGNIHIISIDHDGGKKLQGLGGIGALLRFQLKY
ncbi:MAG: mRNA surveillance protein pelota [Nanoarchaeota archaeon]|nr:mRNA surveillance protein pelota [Nanoarchaeota archaeon]